MTIFNKVNYLAHFFFFVLCLRLNSEILVYSNLDENTQNLMEQEREEIYNIINDYQFPMLQITYGKSDKKEQEEIDDFIEKDDGILRLIQSKLDEKFPKKYLVKYVPDTIFELALIYEFFSHLNNTYNKELEDYFTFQINITDLIKKKQKIYPSYYPMKREKIRAFFLDDTYGVFNKKPEIIDLYFKAINLLTQEISPQVYQQIDPKTVINNLYLLFKKNKSILSRKIDENKLFDNVFLYARGAKSAEEYLELVINENKKDILIDYAKIEAKNFSQGNFLLLRASNGFTLDKDKNVLDSVLDYQKKPLPEGHSFSVRSLSFNNSLLAGSIYESSAINPMGLIESGKLKAARTLDYIDHTKFLYFLPISIKDYLDKNSNVKKSFFISPLNRAVSLLAQGEFFHSRTKVNFNAGNKPWDLKIIGLHGGELGPLFSHHQIYIRDVLFNNYLFTSSTSWFQLALDIHNTLKKAEFIIKKSSVQFAGGNSLIENRLRFELKQKPIRNYVNNPSKNIFDEYGQKNKIPDRIIDESKSTISFFDIRPRVKFHGLLIPKEKYKSIVDFIEKASEKDVGEYFRQIPFIAKKHGLNDSGYRIITNHSYLPSQDAKSDDEKRMLRFTNFAHQEIGHFHTHIAGQEMLNVSGLSEKDPQWVFKNKNNEKLVFKKGYWSSETVKHNISNNLLFKHEWSDEYTFKSYLIDLKLLYAESSVYNSIQDRVIHIGFTITNENDEIPFYSFDDFFNQADDNTIKGFFLFLLKVAKIYSLDLTGMRIFSNNWVDAWHGGGGSGMQFFVAGNTFLGPTVLNAFGNKKPQIDPLTNKIRWSEQMYDYDPVLAKKCPELHPSMKSEDELLLLFKNLNNKKYKNCIENGEILKSDEEFIEQNIKNLLDTFAEFEKYMIYLKNKKLVDENNDDIKENNNHIDSYHKLRKVIAKANNFEKLKKLKTLKKVQDDWQSKQRNINIINWCYKDRLNYVDDYERLKKKYSNLNNIYEKIDLLRKDIKAKGKSILKQIEKVIENLNQTNVYEIYNFNSLTGKCQNNPDYIWDLQFSSPYHEISEWDQLDKELQLLFGSVNNSL
jgi:histidine triad (HIT) family protein